MRVINARARILTPINGKEVLELIERAGRTCYRSKSGEDTAPNFVANLIKRGHESVLEHVNVNVEIVCDRGIMAELTRHRHASFSIESTRYCNYNKSPMHFISPSIDNLPYDVQDMVNSQFVENCIRVESQYRYMIINGATPEVARAILPNSLATTIIMTANLREWRHIFKLRTSKASHPDMRALMIPLLEEFKKQVEVVFDDIKGG